MEQHSKQQTLQKQNHYKRYTQKYKVVSRQFLGSLITYIHFTFWVTVKDELYRKVQDYFSLLFRKILIFFQRVRCDSLFRHAQKNFLTQKQKLHIINLTMCINFFFISPMCIGVYRKIYKMRLSTISISP